MILFHDHRCRSSDDGCWCVTGRSDRCVLHRADHRFGYTLLVHPNDIVHFGTLDHAVLLDVIDNHLGSKTTARHLSDVVGGDGALHPLLLLLLSVGLLPSDIVVFCLANGRSGDQAKGTADQGPGKWFVVVFADRGTDCGTGDAANCCA